MVLTPFLFKMLRIFNELQIDSTKDLPVQILLELVGCHHTKHDIKLLKILFSFSTFPNTHFDLLDICHHLN